MTEPTNPAEVDDEIWKWYVTEGINNITRWHPGATEKHAPPEDEKDSEESAAPSPRPLGTECGRPGAPGLGDGRAHGSGAKVGVTLGAGPDNPGATAGVRGHTRQRPWSDNVLSPAPGGQKFDPKSDPAPAGRSGEQEAAEAKPRHTGTQDYGYASSRQAELENSPAAWTRADRATFDWTDWAATWTPPTEPATTDRPALKRKR